jgi:hypothetical protein
VGLDDAGDLPCVAGHLKRHPIVGPQAASEQLERRRGRLDPPRGGDLTALYERDLAEVAVNIQSDRSHLILLLLS